MAKGKTKGDKLKGVYVYDPGLSHFIFFVSGALLVVFWFAMIGQDYARGWKHWQKAFFREETRQLEESLAEERSTIEGQKAQLQTDLEQARSDLAGESANLDRLQKELAEVQRSLSNAERELKFEKAREDERRYNVEKALESVAKERDVESYEALLAYRVEGDPTRTQYDPSELELLDQVPMWKDYVEGAKRIAGYHEEVKRLTAEEASLKGQVDQIAGRKKDLQAKLAAMDRGVSRLENQIAKVDARPSNIFRNLPILDFLAPQVQIKQTVISDIHFNVNFMEVEAVDRCQTCHIAIDKPGYEDMPNPLKTHPHLLDLFTGGKVKDPSTGEEKVVPAKHPFEKFGCTVCHLGRGRETSFVGAVHTPDDMEEEESWKEKYGWKEDHYWDFPMLQSSNVYSSCYQCHAGRPVLEGAGRLNDARAMFAKAGCYACHKVATGGFEDLPKPGPSLYHIGSKTTPEWAWRWLRAPREFRAETTMPHFWGLLNNSRTPEDVKRDETEIHAIVSYLFAHSTPQTYEPAPLEGDAASGERILYTRGCTGCHQVGYEDGVKRWEPRHFGPNLSGVGSKVDPAWLYQWVRNPKVYNPKTRMPNLRLTDSQAADVVAFLMDQRKPEWEARPVPSLDKDALAGEVHTQLLEQMSEEEADTKLHGMSQDDQLQFLGQKLISRYGCFSCHDIDGFENYGRIGTELTTEADKFIEKLDFGHVHIPRTKQDWFFTKLRTPRVYDVGKVLAVKDRLRMPSFGFTKEEADLLVTFLMGLRKNVVSTTKAADLSPREQAQARGERLVFAKNCRGCHVYEGTGGAIRPVLLKYLTKKEGMEPAAAEGYYPPAITGEGAKVQSDWLVQFLQQPWAIRPWMRTVMPTFGLDNEEVNVLVNHFIAASDVTTFSTFSCDDASEQSIEAGRKLASEKYFKCFTCHVQGEKTPAGTPDRWAPDLAQVNERLRHDWIISWLKDPGALQPGTKMPQFFYDPSFLPKEILGGDMQAQTRALADYLTCGLGKEARSPARTAGKARSEEEESAGARAPTHQEARL